MKGARQLHENYKKIGGTVSGRFAGQLAGRAAGRVAGNVPQGMLHGAAQDDLQEVPLAARRLCNLLTQISLCKLKWTSTIKAASVRMQKYCNIIWRLAKNG